MKMEDVKAVNDDRTKKLLLGLIFDAIGMLTYSIPGFAEPADLIWAPIAAFIMTRMYKGRVGKVASVLTFVEEILPGTDIIPSFTITWIYTYYFQKGNN
ncbi:hypothetical protein ACHRVZ_03640 [Flavobacterium sp. FlaQc-57]|uniref:hypothetical protein n=1 Tax=Flavobacterium sp. FlaQc-57 TaxID=3374186 RepID=UPI003756BF05